MNIDILNPSPLVKYARSVILAYMLSVVETTFVLTFTFGQMVFQHLCKVFKVFYFRKAKAISVTQSCKTFHAFCEGSKRFLPKTY